MAWYQSEQFAKTFPYVLAAILIIGTILAILYEFMLWFMSAFFIVFSLAKMIDWPGFVTAYQEYDLLAMRLSSYAWAYPAIEFILGALFFIAALGYQPLIVPIAYFTILISAIGALGVAIKLSKRERFQCACLGTRLNVPLTKVTLLENLLMLVMATLLI